MYIKILKFIINCLGTKYSLLDSATITFSLIKTSEEVEKNLSANLKKEYLDIKKQINDLSKSEKKMLFSQIQELSDYYIAVAAQKDAEPTYDTNITDKVGTLASMTLEYNGPLN